MGYYDEPENVDQYEKMCQEYDGSQLYLFVEKHLPTGSSILELGTGPGHDLQYLNENYNVTGSDLSKEFIKRLQQKYPTVTVHQLDAVTIDIKEQFDCIFSNKVLHHLHVEQLEKSFERQKEVLKPNGIFAHTFWIGEEDMNMHGMFFKYHEKSELIELVSSYFEVIDTLDYEEFSKADSLFIIAKNKEQS